jgi:hypothetical protein
MQSRIGLPMLPQAAALTPAASSIASVSSVTVVFPLVPVMQIHS